MRLSSFGERLASGSGIVQLMDDLGNALAVNREMLMLGGGNPGRIPEMEARFRTSMNDLLASEDRFEKLVGQYDPPSGSPAFRAALAGLLRREYGWEIGPENIAITNGSQSASFMLFNLFAGERADGETGKVLLPLAPEYIGYADQGLTENFFSANRPAIELLDDHLFKYRVDFDALTISNDTAALCLSRPTNPTGNVVTDDELSRLASLAERHDIPLIVDNAYGLPFPGITFVEAAPMWSGNVVLCMSLSKVGLPGVRTGIIVADEEIVRAISGMNAVLNLTTGGFGTALAFDMVRSGEILRLGREVIRPFYERKAHSAIAMIRRELRGVDFHIHKPEGAIFLWLWLRDLPIRSQTLYERVKNRGALVLSGHHFFPGIDPGWDHVHQCIRITYSQDDADVEAGLRILCDEIRRAYLN